MHRRRWRAAENRADLTWHMRPWWARRARDVQCARNASTSSGLAVDLLELRLGVRDHVFCRSTSAGLGEHVDDHIFGDTLRQLPARRRRPAQEMGTRERVAVWHIAWFHLPHRRVVIVVQEWLIIGVGGGIPSAELLRVGEPAQKGSCLLFCRCEVEDPMANRAHDMESPFRAHWVLRLVSDLGDLWEVALGQPQDALSIIGARDLLGEPG